MNGDILFREFDIWTRRDILGDAIFPRHLTLTRDIINNEYEFYSFYKLNLATDIYMSVFSLYQVRRRLFDTIFIDIDPCKKYVYPRELFLDAYEKFMEVKQILDDNDYTYRVYFSGRGFHIYIDFNIVRLEHYQGVVKKFLAELGIIDSNGQSKYVDTRVIGDMMRMARFPLTKNSKTGLYMKRIDPEWSINEIWEYVNSADAYRPVDVERNNARIIHHLMELDKTIEDVHVSRRVYNDYIEDWDISSMPMCVREGIMRLKYLGELDHMWRWIVANFLLRAKGYDYTYNLFKMAKDFSPVRTRSQLSHMMKKRYKQYGCDKIRDMGICPYKDDPSKCPFYPSMNLWLPSWEQILGDDNEGK